MSEIRVMPLPKVTGVWKHDSSKYPDVVRVPMSDGRVIRYRIDIEQPHPQLLKAIDNIRNMKRAGGCGNSQPAAYENDQNNSITEGGKSE